ncbi:hypothetical protein RSC3_02589 [Bacillus paralicheniformis]|nr:hypothetical protein RSC3_02589 [Bacillus paralicheniformis]
MSGFMEKFERNVERFLVPVAAKLNSQRHICAIRDAFILSFPIIMAGSIIILLNFAILSPDGFIANILFLEKIFPNLADYQSVFTPYCGDRSILCPYLLCFSSHAI